MPRDWSIPGVELSPGSSEITVTAIDNAGNENTDTIAVTYNNTSETAWENRRDAEAYFNRGNTYLEKGDYDQAISDSEYSRAIELDPKYATAYNNRGIAYGSKGEDDRAIADCTKAIELDPKNATFYHNRGYAYYNKGQYNKAWDDINKAKSLGYQVEPWVLERLRKAVGK